MILLDKFEQNNPVKRAAKIHMETLPFFHGICQRQFARYQFPQEFHLDQFFILLHFPLKEALKGEDIEAIKAKQEELQKELFAVSEKVYKAANPQGTENAQPQGGAQNGDPNVYEADYTDVDDNNKQ